jgi:hypothetical protein
VFAPTVKLTFNPAALQVWYEDIKRFAQYRGELVETLRWFGEQAVTIMKEAHPPGGPHPAMGELPVYPAHKYIDRSGWLTDSIGFTLEPFQVWEPGAGSAPALPTLTIFATAPYAVAVEYGVPGHSRPFSFFWPTIERLLPEAAERIAAIMTKANQFRGR